MRADGDGRFCERCSLHIAEVTSLDEKRLERLLVDDGRVCARFELERGHPRTKFGIAAGFVVATLCGCATLVATEAQRAAPVTTERDSLDGRISGVVRDASESPLANAIVILESTALTHPYEAITNRRGSYVFKHLPPGTYTIRVLYNLANTHRGVTLPQDAHVRANFRITPGPPIEVTEILMGVIIPDRDVRPLDLEIDLSEFRRSD
jgi:hypothetical protein